MKILWVSPFFLHPTDRGAQIRTLGTLKELHRTHEVHFAALNSPDNLEGPRRASEYSSLHVAVEHAAPARASLAVLPQLAASLFSPVPLAVSRYASPALKRRVATLIARHHYDAIVCDFLAAAPNIPDLSQAILFQHNVETTIWQRHVERATSPLKRAFFRMQASKMEAYERQVCAQSRFVIAVSDIDAERMKKMFSINNVRSVPTGVDLAFFQAPTAPLPPDPTPTDILFCGSMDWLPNIDAMEHFLAEVLPLIRAQRPATSVTIAGRAPDRRVFQAAEGIAGVTITGSVPDMRPFLWNSRLSIVPIRIGGGTRLKIYECMAASLPVVSSTIGAEGLTCHDHQDILLADSPADFAHACLHLLEDEPARATLAANALKLVEDHFSWAAVTRQFEAILVDHQISS